MNQQTNFRPYTPEDIGVIHGITTRAAEVDGIDPRSTLEDIPTLEELAESLEQGNGDVLVGFDTNGNIIGYGQMRWWQEEDGTLVYLHTGTIDPEHRRKGHGSALLGALEARIHEVATTHGQNTTKVIGANSSETEPGKTAMLKRRGYGNPVHSMVEMEYVDPDKLPDVELPEGFTLKTSATLEEKRKIYEANKKVYEGTFGISPTSDEDFEEFLEDNPDSSTWRVVWQGDELAGFVISRHRDDRSAEIMEVTVVDDERFRGKGLGKFLMTESIRSLQTEGAELIRLHTDAEGKMGGRQLYENIGFIARKEHARYRKPIEIATDRLKLRPIKKSDAEPMSDVLGNEAVMEFSDDGALEDSQINDWISGKVEQFEATGRPVMAVTDQETGEVIGYCGLFDCEIEGVSEVEIGFRFAANHWGKGYATEAVTALLDYARQNLRLERVVAMIDPSNEGSLGVAEKLGMKYEKDIMIPGYDHPDKLYVSTTRDIRS